jgi:hypothetical protein
LREVNIKVFTAEDFEVPMDEEVQSKIRAEVDEFLQMLEDQREINKKFSAGRDKLW